MEELSPEHTSDQGIYVKLPPKSGIEDFLLCSSHESSQLFKDSPFGPWRSGEVRSGQVKVTAA